MSAQPDIVVVGAGIVGVSVAIHLLKRGRSVLLVDRRAPGLETSYGNSGLIQRDGLSAFAFPRQLRDILRYAQNRAPELRYHLWALPALAPFLFRYWYSSEPTRLRVIARHFIDLIEHGVAEHEPLIAEAGAERLIRRKGLLKVFRTERGRDSGFQDAQKLVSEFGYDHSLLSSDDVARREPHLSVRASGAVHWPHSITTVDPGGLVGAYFKLFQTLGGQFLQAEARQLSEAAIGWELRTDKATVASPAAVVALGPWSSTFTQSLGYRFPLIGKRGYHKHYRPVGDAELNHSISHGEDRYFMAPMSRGIRLTTGVELAAANAPPTPDQLELVEAMARGLFPLGDPVEKQPWYGSRPATPDMLPIVGAAPRHRNLWLSFGHAHHGLTLGPATGRLLAEMIAGERPYLNPAPYRPERFC